MLVMWRSTPGVVTTSCLAMNWLERPSAISARTSRVLIEGPVHGVHDRRRLAVGHRECGVAAVIVQHVEGPPGLRRAVDRRKGERDVIGLEQRALDVLRMRGLEQGMNLGR